MALFGIKAGKVIQTRDLLVGKETYSTFYYCMKKYEIANNPP